MSRRTPAVLASFIGAALLFTIQPYVARLVLPRLGGSPTVWSTCQVFFQAALLLGYGYSHATTRWLTPKRQAMLHLLVLALPLAALPIGVPPGWAPPGDADPTLSLLSLLARAVLLPFAVVATTAPLIQRWYARSGEPDAAQPYSLYAASNLGSLVGLLAYPFLIEPTLRLGTQGKAWAAGYVVFIVAVARCAWPSLRGTDAEPVPAPFGEDEPARPAARPLDRWQAARWVALSAAPSALLLGVTAHITTDVLSAPLLWAVPLALYLATFVHAFAARPLFPAEWLAARLPVFVALAAFLLAIGPTLAMDAWLGLPVHLLALTAVAAACHGALAQERPHASHLTAYYLLMSLGGVIGGLLGGLLPPLVLHSVAEYPAALVVGCALLHDPDLARSALASVDGGSGARRAVFVALGLGGLLFIVRILALLGAPHLPAALALAIGHPATVPSIGVAGALVFGWRRPRRFAFALAATLLATSVDLADLNFQTGGRIVLAADRSFFGVHRVISSHQPAHGETPALNYHQLVHGTTLHGAQLADPESDEPILPGEPLTYYSRRGPVGWSFDALAARPQGRPRRIGIVGLGAGALAACFEEGQEVTYFEIDPVVVRLAEDVHLFTYLAGARQRGAAVDIVLGDGRVTVARAPEGAFDLLVLDAFSSDSIPAHLLTREAFAVWKRALAPHGVLLFNVTNRALQVHVLLGDVTADAGLVARMAVDDEAFRPDSPDPRRIMRSRSRWVVAARDAADLGGIMTDPRFAPHPGDPSRAWTDDFQSILDLIWRD